MSAKRFTTLLLTLAVVALVVATPAIAEDDPAEAYKDIADLKQDISILNLLNGLHLTDEQRTAILVEARSAQALKERYLARRSESLAEAEESFLELKLRLIGSQSPPSKEVTSAAKRNNAEIKRVHESYVDELTGMEKRVARVLTDGQKEILVDFKPCLNSSQQRKSDD